MKQIFQQLKIFYWFMLAVQLAFAITVVLLEGLPRRLGKLSFDDPLLLTGILVAFFLIGIAYWLNGQRKMQGAQLANREEKALHYRSLVVIRCAMVQGANFFALLMAFVSGQGVFFALFAAGLPAFAYFRPQIREFVRDYNLRPDEEEF